MRRVAFAVLPVAVLAFGAGLALAGRNGPDQKSQLRIVRVASGLTEPVVVTAPPNEPNNVYVVEKVGRVRVIVRGHLRARPFLDIRSLVLDSGEQGMLGLAFSPKYAKNRHFYVDYTDRNGDARIVEYRSRGLSRTPKKLRQIFFQDDPYPNHNGGNLVFGPGGYLFTGTGDGGSGGDPENRAQNLKSTFGKLLRFNVDVRRPAPVIVGYGLRNPWRVSFDRATGAIAIGDVGQNQVEEVDFARRSGARGVNYGWRVFEGRRRNYSGESAPGAVFPVLTYGHGGGGCSITGGYVVRDPGLRALAGQYVYGDFCLGRLRAARVAPGSARGDHSLGLHVSQLSSFGEDVRGHVYATSLDGPVYRLAPR